MAPSKTDLLAAKNVEHVKQVGKDFKDCYRSSALHRQDQIVLADINDKIERLEDSLAEDKYKQDLDYYRDMAVTLTKMVDIISRIDRISTGFKEKLLVILEEVEGSETAKDLSGHVKRANATVVGADKEERALPVLPEQRAEFFRSQVVKGKGKSKV